MVSLDQRKDIVTEKLKEVNLLLTQANSRLMEADVRWKQVQECHAAKGNLANQSFIASSPLIQTLVQQGGAPRRSRWRTSSSAIGQSFRRCRGGNAFPAADRDRAGPGAG